MAIYVTDNNDIYPACASANTYGFHAGRLDLLAADARRQNGVTCAIQ